MLGGPDGQTLFLMLAEWAGVENAPEQVAKRTGEVRMVHVDVPHAGRPWPAHWRTTSSFLPAPRATCGT